jgi:hypothetical protein
VIGQNLKLAQGLWLPKALLSYLRAERIYFSESTPLFISRTSPPLFPFHLSCVSSEHSFTSTHPKNRLSPAAVSKPNTASFGCYTSIQDPICLNGAVQVSHYTTAFQIAFSWRISVSYYCSPDVVASLSPIWITSGYFLPIRLISVCFCIAFLSLLELSTPPTFASPQAFC